MKDTKGRELLRRAIEERGMSQRQVDAALGATGGMCCRWLAGHRRPEARRRLALEALLGIPAEAWLTEVERAEVEALRG